MTELGRAIYAELRRRWLAGGRRPFLAPHRELAEILGCSPGVLPRHMQALVTDHLIIRERYKNKYRFRLPDGPSAWDPIASSRDRSASSRDRSVSVDAPAPSDAPAAETVDLATGRDRAPDDGGDRSDSIPPHPPMVHVSMQQQQQTSESWAGRQGDQTVLRAELANDDADVVAELFRRHPAITLTEFAREVVAAESRPNVFCPRAVALKALSSGERVRAARASPPPGPTGDPPPERTRRPKDRWADDRPASLSREWAAFLAEQEDRDRRYAQRLGQEAPHAATT